MTYVERIEPEPDGQQRARLLLWRQIASEATAEIIAAVPEARKDLMKARARVWQGLKPHLLWLFNDKCAFCESKFLAVSFGDVEHFRPKRGVKDDPTHTGYYWLAFDEFNLLPGCERCNRNAKANHFPIRGGRAQTPEHPLVDELPLLINPCEVDPREHLDFATSEHGQPTGLVVALTEVGKISIEIFNLNREDLVEARKREQEFFMMRYLKLLSNHKTREIVKLFKGAIEEPYSAACTALGKALIDDFRRDVVQHIGGR